MSLTTSLQNLFRPVIAYRVLLSFGLSIACGVMLQSLYPIHDADPMLRLIALERPAIFHALLLSYNLFLYSTPFLLLSILFSLAYVHLYAPVLNGDAGPLPPYPEPGLRRNLSLIVGEVHRQLAPAPSPHPEWISLPERGLYTGICVIGAIGSGKTQALVLPAMRQLFAYCAHDAARKLSGIVLEVKGDLCRQLRKLLIGCGREQDYVEVSLAGDLRYNPLNNDLDPYIPGVSYRQRFLLSRALEVKEMEINSPDLFLRISGIEYTEVKLSYVIKHRLLPERREVSIKDPHLGTFALTEDCLIEIRHGDGPWMRIMPKTLIAVLETERKLLTSEKGMCMSNQGRDGHRTATANVKNAAQLVESSLEHIQETEARLLQVENRMRGWGMMEKAYQCARARAELMPVRAILRGK